VVELSAVRRRAIQDGGRFPARPPRVDLRDQSIRRGADAFQHLDRGRDPKRT